MSDAMLPCFGHVTCRSRKPEAAALALLGQLGEAKRPGQEYASMVHVYWDSLE